MKTIKTFGVALIALLALGALSASAAEAYEWRINGESIAKATAASATSTITFKNLGEGYAFHCTIVNKGTVGPGAKGEITSLASSGGAKAIPCELTETSADCESGMEIEAVGLPWATELVAVNGDLRNKLTAAHEWKLKCKEAGGVTKTNECGVPGSTGPHNLSTSVEDLYDSGSPTTTSCFDDSPGRFTTTGSEVLSSTAGSLQVSPTPLEWRLGGAILGSQTEVSWSGKIKVTGGDHGEPEYVECEAKVKGLSGLGGAGEVTAFSVSGCSGKIEYEHVACEKGKYTTIEALNLPWRTELVTEGGVTRDVMVNSGAGATGFKMSCEFVGLGVSNKCTGAIKLATTNVTSGVNAVFDASEKLNCVFFQGGSESVGTVEGTQTIVESLGFSKLEVT